MRLEEEVVDRRVEEDEEDENDVDDGVIDNVVVRVSVCVLYAHS